MSIEIGNAAFATNVESQNSSEGAISPLDEFAQPQGTGNPILSAVVGTALSGCFYGVVYAASWAPLQRYFLGHPVAVAATVLFWFAVAVLATKWVGILSQLNQLEAIRDEDLLPPSSEDSPAGRWLQQKDARHVATSWLAEIARLPSETRDSHMVARLRELLTRQSQRGTTKHLADDLRELSARDADAAHDSLGLVRIIVWAIPMLGFLGTVIGITQTLGGLDFSDGTAAVQNLKSGLYVAFDTTALGLVLSVVAIFLQFPIERREQRLLSTIDLRVGHLVSSSLPSDETSDNQTALIADLCQGVQAAVAESLDNQARLWRTTIDEAQQQWQAVHEANNNSITRAFEQTLVPALVEHAKCMTESSRVAGDRLRQECDRWKETIDEAQQIVRRSNESAAQLLVNGLNSVLTPALSDHAKAIDASAQIAADRVEQQCGRWQETISGSSEIISSQQRSLTERYEALTEQYEALTEANAKAESIASLQFALDSSLERLAETNASLDRSVTAAGGDGMADAMRVLARAVDMLATRLAHENADDTSRPSRYEQPGRAA